MKTVATTSGGSRSNLHDRLNASAKPRHRIEAAIEDCTYFADLALDEHRYYLFNEFHETDIHKTTKGGIWGARVFNLSEWLDYNEPTTEYSSEEAAERLKGEEFV